MLIYFAKTCLKIECNATWSYLTLVDSALQPVLMFTFHKTKIAENLNAPSIASALRFLLRRQGDSGGLQGQALVPSEPTIDKQIIRNCKY